MRKKKICYFALSAMMIFATSCSDDALNEESVIANQIESANSINTSGVVDGLTYSLKGVDVNPNLIIIDGENATVVSSEEEMSSGIVKLTKVSDQLLNTFGVGNILYIQTSEHNELKKIVNVLSSNGDSYTLETTQAQLGEVFQGGEMNLSLDLYQVAKIEEEKQPKLRLTYGDAYFFDIANLMNDYDMGGFKYNPATNIKMNLDMKMVFSNMQILPSELSTIFEIKTNINPVLTYAGSINQVYQDDLIKYTPSQIVDLIKKQEFNIDIPINVLGIKTLPAKIKIQDIHLPTQIESNLSKQSSLNYNVEGSFKAGYIMTIEGFEAKIDPVYENKMSASISGTDGLHGEILTQSDIVITPSISIIDNAYKVSGEIKFGVKTESNGHIELLGKAPIFGTQGTFTSTMNLVVDLVLLKIPVEIFNNEIELWKKGSIDRTITYSDLKWKSTSRNTTNILAGTKSYTTEFVIGYKYPIANKMIANELLLSYDVYQKDGKTKLESVKDVVIKPLNATTSSFGFNLSIPYKKEGGIFSSRYQTVSYLKNITIKDRKGYVYEGVYNTAKGVVENSFEIKR